MCITALPVAGYLIPLQSSQAHFTICSLGLLTAGDNPSLKRLPLLLFLFHAFHYIYYRICEIREFVKLPFYIICALIYVPWNISILDCTFLICCNYILSGNQRIFLATQYTYCRHAFRYGNLSDNSLCLSL